MKTIKEFRREVMMRVGLPLASIGLLGLSGNAGAHTTGWLSVASAPVVLAAQVAGRQVGVDRSDNVSPERLVLAARYGQIDLVQYLLTADVPVNARDAYGNTALIAAAGNGHRQVVEYLLEHGANVQAQNKEEFSPLMTAAASGHYELVHHLLEMGAEVNMVNNQGESALFLAVQYGHMSAVKVLLTAGANPNLANTLPANRQEGGFTPLMYVASHGLTTAEVAWPDFAKVLLDNGANPNQENIHGETALVFARRKNDDAMQTLLMSSGAKDTQAYVRLSPDEALLKAAKLGDLYKSQQLLPAQANVNYVDRNGVTPLLAAAHLGHLALVKILLEHGAEVNFVPSGLRQFAMSKSHAPLSEREMMQVASRGDTALLAAARAGHADVVTYLLDHKAQIELANRQGETALIVVASQGDLGLVQRLLDAGANANTLILEKRHRAHTRMAAPIMGRDSVLIAAAKTGHVAVAEALLTSGADVNLRGEGGRTALFHAAKGGHVALVDTLLAHGADAGINTLGGTSVLMVAAQRGQHDIVSALLSHGAQVNAIERPELGFEAQASNEGMTALMYAARHGHAMVVEQLLSAGAMARVSNNLGKRALDEALDNGHEQVVKMLDPGRVSSDVTLYRVE